MTRTGWPIINPSLSLFLSPLPKRSIDGTMGNESMYPLVRNYVARNTTWNIGCNVDKYRATTMWTRGIIGKSNREVTFPIGSPRVPNVWQTIVLFSLASLTRIRTPPHSGIMYHRKINNFDRGDSSSRGKGTFRWINAVGKKSVGVALRRTCGSLRAENERECAAGAAIYELAELDRRNTRGIQVLNRLPSCF